MRSEFGGDPAGGRRPNRSTRHAGMPLGEAPLVHPSDVARALRLSADPSGESPVDLEYAWRGLDPTRFDFEVVATPDDQGQGGLGRFEGELVRLVSVMGPPGPQGPQGATGPQGPSAGDPVRVTQVDPMFAGPGLWVKTRADGSVESMLVKPT